MILIEKILMKKIMLKKILMKKNLINKIKHRMRKKKKKHVKHNKIILNKKKDTMLETDIKIFLKKKNKSFSIGMDVIRIFLRKKKQSKLGI